MLGGEAYIQFKPDLLDENGALANPGTRNFLQGYVDRFVDLVEKLTPQSQ